ncbi:hypothetical protein F7725_006577 [Dissostichus mawsoni]|uniref:Solute carrier family 66 member 3 n=1 Tax=Dissostichus mawsoni TaxID=36200 RepID=A0A7J5XUB1_DISMA|nr:hypothetical protein F7725_006577 [Dissostichus mawsoni]
MFQLDYVCSILVNVDMVPPGSEHGPNDLPTAVTSEPAFDADAAKRTSPNFLEPPHVFHLLGDVALLCELDGPGGKNSTMLQRMEMNTSGYREKAMHLEHFAVHILVPPQAQSNIPGCSSTMAPSAFKNFLVTFLMPEKCYERFFVNFHMNAQLPQLLKILWRRSADGLSLTSALLQLYAFSCPVVYAIAHHFPLFAWGERLITLSQTAAIVFLIVYYRGQTLTGILFLLAFGGAVFLLASYAAAAVVSAMQASSLPALIASKAGTNHSNDSTGQLSSLSVLLSWAGSLGFIFVSLQETGNWLATVSHTLSACLSCVLLAQVLCPDATKKKSE